MRTTLAGHPRFFAWVGLSLVLVALILLASLGRELQVSQYLGLAAVAVVTAGISVALVFDDERDPHAKGTDS